MTVSGQLTVPAERLQWLLVFVLKVATIIALAPYTTILVEIRFVQGVILVRVALLVLPQVILVQPIMFGQKNLCLNY
jgi:hypothetical protein